jgi:glycosyltransferase involved in cell wall biosynthesis
MNILIINHYAGSPKHGMESRHYNLAQEYLRLGHRVLIVGASFSHLRNKNPEVKGLITKERIDSVDYLWLKTPSYQGNGVWRVLNMLTFGLLLSILVSKMVKYFTPDIIIASSPHPFIIYGAKSIARATKAKLMFEVRDLWPLTLTELGGISPEHPFIKMMQKAEEDAYRDSDCVISLLPKANSYMKEHGMKEDKFVYIPNGIRIEEWNNKSKTDNQTTHIRILSEMKRIGQFIVGYAGQHGLANELYTLVNAALLLKDQPIAFVLVGQGPEKEKLREIVQQKGLQNVSFLPSVPKSEIPNILNLMDVLYIGLKKESLFRFGVSPNKLMDYMMAGKPIIHAIDAGNDMVSDCNCGISVPPEDPLAIKNAIIKLFDMTTEEKTAMGARGKEYVMSQHDYKVLAKRSLEHRH